MPMPHHLVELQDQHRAIENELAEAQRHPSTDDLTIVKLKRRKLLLKDAIARLDSDSVH
jgi:hypothetical protein